MPRKPLAFALAVGTVAFAGLSIPASAASFDCNKAATPVEYAICGNPGLSSLDSEMAALYFAYSQFPMLMGSRGARQDEARAFIQSRNSCGPNVSCLRGAYHARINMLKGQITAQAQNTCSAG